MVREPTIDEVREAEKILCVGGCGQRHDSNCPARSSGACTRVARALIERGEQRTAPHAAESPKASRQRVQKVETSEDAGPSGD